MPASVAPATSEAARPSAVRTLGRFQLLRLLGRSARTMAWRVLDPRSGQELVLVMPRTQPHGPALLRWTERIQRAARLQHPALAAVVEVGVQEGWPFVAHDPREDGLLAERIDAQGLPPLDAARLVVQLLQGLAFAHEAGMAHHDLQAWQLLVSPGGTLRLIGLEVAPEADGAGGRGGAALDAATLQAQREAAARDVLGAGLLLHHLLTGEPALGEADLGEAVARLPPGGRDPVRLPWSLPRPVPDPLRVIANRSTDRQLRQRYRAARSLLRALDGWLQSEADGGAGPLALLIDRLHAVGVLPGSPGGADMLARLARMERERTNELAGVVLGDVGLSFELLRAVNTARVRGTQVAGAGPVLTVRRAIAMLGLDGVRRAALTLRAWPGPLAEPAAQALQELLARTRRAARIAQALRPAGYDPELVLLVTLLQNLGRLVTAYHFPDEAQQVRRLMQAVPAEREGEPPVPGLDEESASFAVLGVDTEAMGAAVARHAGLPEEALQLIRKLPAATPVRPPEGDDAVLRALASCAHEAVDALDHAQPPAALQRVAQRYGRALGLSLKDLQAALLGTGRPGPAGGDAAEPGRDAESAAADAHASEAAPAAVDRAGTSPA